MCCVTRIFYSFIYNIVFSHSGLSRDGLSCTKDPLQFTVVLTVTVVSRSFTNATDPILTPNRATTAEKTFNGKNPKLDPNP